jgi:hypothetical protein
VTNCVLIYLAFKEEGDNIDISAVEKGTSTKDKIKEFQREYDKNNQIKIKEYYKKNQIKMKEYLKNYYKKNQIKMKEYRKDYYKKNLDEIKETRNEYYKKNLDEIKETRRDYYKKNLDEIRKYRIDYYKKNQNIIKTKGNYKKENRKEYYRKIRNLKNPNFIRPYYSWKSREEARKNFESVVSLFHITDFSDWYRISQDQIRQSEGLIYIK